MIKFIIQEIIIEKCENCVLTQTFRVYNPSSVWKITVKIRNKKRNPHARVWTVRQVSILKNWREFRRSCKKVMNFVCFPNIPGKLQQFHVRCCLPFSKKKSGNFGWKSNETGTDFPENPFGNCWLPLGTERRKCSHHLVNFPVSSLSSAENNYEKSNCKWQAPFRLVGLLIWNSHLNRFILTNVKLP